MLKRKGNTDDGQRKGKTQRNMTDEDPETRKDHPQEIAEKSQRARVVGLKHLPEGSQRQTRQLEALKSKRNTDNGEAEEKTSQKILEGGQKTATENDPKQVEKKIQRLRAQSKG